MHTLSYSIAAIAFHTGLSEYTIRNEARIGHLVTKKGARGSVASTEALLAWLEGRVGRMGLTLMERKWFTELDQIAPPEVLVRDAKRQEK
jgi:hypothetical protein